MEITHIPFSHFPMLAKMDKAYASQEPILRKFYKYHTDIESFRQVIEDKAKDNIDREVLKTVLMKQYEVIKAGMTDSNLSSIPLSNIEKLADKATFTVVTAHQPSLLTGPLYFIYKICSTIHLSQLLKKHYPDNHFVPVFVIGGEDHDFDEVNYINIFQKKLIWEKSEHSKGAVGLMKTDSLKPVLEELKQILGNSEQAQQVFDTIEKAYTSFDLYQEATQALLHNLFGQYGLVVINMNDAVLKRLFIPVMKQELLEHTSKKWVETTQHELESLGYKPQAYVRDINLFYLRDNLRERIVLENGFYKTVSESADSKIWTEKEIIQELETTPQYFSPNVVLRPLFQEIVLPNLAYIGGGGELAYWLERKSQFEYYGVNFPMLVRRNSVLWIDKASKEKMVKLKVQILDLVHDTDTFVKQYVERITEVPLSMSNEKEEIESIFNKILKKAISIDATLEKTVLAEKTKQLQSIDIIEAKLLKAEKQKNESSINQLKGLAQKLFPAGGLQERTDNFLPLYIKHGDAFIQTLLHELNPLVQGMIVFWE